MELVITMLAHVRVVQFMTGTESHHCLLCDASAMECLSYCSLGKYDGLLGDVCNRSAVLVPPVHVGNLLQHITKSVNTIKFKTVL